MSLSKTADPNVERGAGSTYASTFAFDKPIRSVTWLDNGKAVAYNGKATVTTQPFFYGCHWVVRVAKIICDE